jgi:MoxR-like ATPase
MGTITNKIFTDYSDIESTQDEISAILERRERSNLNDKEIGAMGGEVVGSIRTVTDTSGYTTTYRKQANGRWAEAHGPRDIWEQENGSLTPEEKDDILINMEISKPTTVSSLIPNAEQYLENQFNVMMIALHGVGKTVSLKEIAERRGYKMKYFSCSTLDPYTDLVGVPTPRMYCPECKLWYKDAERCDCGGQTVESLKMVRPHDVDEAQIIFFDEFNRADSKTQNAVFEIIQFRTINGEPLPNLMSCWAAINPPDVEQNYQVDPMDVALIDRFDIFIEMTPKPSIPYMSQHMPKKIASALKVWWDDHTEAAKRKEKEEGGLPAYTNYISPRRLEKIGLVWCATKNQRDVSNSIPSGIHAEERKLFDLLSRAQKEIDLENGVITEEQQADDDLGGDKLGDRPYDGFIYGRKNIKADGDKISEWLLEHPLAAPTHEKIVDVLKDGIGGEELILSYRKVLNGLNNMHLEALLASCPRVKQKEMRKAFANLYENDPTSVEGLDRLYEVLGAGDDKPANWPNLSQPATP